MRLGHHYCYAHGVGVAALGSGPQEAGCPCAGGRLRPAWPGLQGALRPRGRVGLSPPLLGSVGPAAGGRGGCSHPG
eukprot:15437092-Alexandrium_andersonii.AAC.1